MDLLISVIIVGMAAGYVTETLAMLYDRPYIRLLSTLSVSAAGLYFSGVVGTSLVIATLAAGFFSALLLKVINRPVVVDSLRRR
jgi:NhaP-type Na+/H+ or K+/H+ antiporter